MKKIKKLTALACVLALGTGLLAGCGSSSSSDSKNVTVNIFQFKVEAKTALEKAVKDYESNHPNVTINVQTVGGGQDYGAALKSKFSSGDEPTIYNIGGPQDTVDWKNKLEDLSNQPWISKAYDGTLDAVKKDGKVYGMPFDLEGYGFIYNKAIFAKAGIDASSIKSYADLEKAVQTLDSKKSALGIDSVFALPGKETWVTGLHLSNAVLAPELKDGVSAFNAKTIDFKYNDALKKLLDLQIKYGYKPDGTNKSINSVDYSTQVEQKFSLSKVAIIQQGNWIYGTVNGVDKDLAKNMGLLPIPVDGVKDGAVPVGVPMYWAINKDKDTATKKAAEDFLNWLYTSDKGKQMIIHDFQFIPAFKGYEASNLQPDDPISKAILQYSNDKNTIPWVFMGYPTGWGQNKLGADIQKYISGDLSWDQLVQNAKDNWAAARK
ncbi:raffinose/stachyose/melibiose transport system substrate-binding protein [Clostridium acidisoli DSM 12555]|uniref:Raffinose/stachyose/melibiose transport system substrate-binding protein n=1 Tax=Clostridium acidisoli DSM 12555 TaxID=1121291 RepID=A0A1W1XNB8_9CLOT|nr:ABC transporter substrate-binding protein [Clostridium acidisoli]SMC24998.1 raffinose/stachyose/melibiose transport system substrate-binding protein [Clostridium acidisoli DSM 12555]